MTYSILSAGALGHAVTDAYGLPGPWTCHLLRRGLHDQYLLNADRYRYLVRVDRCQWRSPVEISYECDLLLHLAAKGVPVSPPLAASDGARVLPVNAPEGTRPLVLFPYVSGPPLAWTDLDHCRRAGRLLATIHVAAEDLASAYGRSTPRIPSLIDSALAALRPFFADRPADWTYLEGFGARLCARLAEAANTGVDSGPCHGDFVAANIHVMPDGTLNVSGFDRSGPNFRAGDFVGAWSASPDGSASAGWQAFVEGYTECRVFDASQLSLVPLCRASRHLNDMALYAANVDEWGTSRIGNSQIDEWLELLRRWESECALDGDG